MNAFVTGPTAGYFDDNRQAFEEASRKVDSVGWRAVTLLRVLDHAEDYVLPYSIRLLLDSGTLVVLPGWEASDLCRIHVLLAAKLGKPIHVHPTLSPLPDDHVPRLKIRHG